MWVDVDEVLNEYRTAVLDLAEKVLGKTIDPMATPGTSWDVFDIFSPEEAQILLSASGQPGFCASIPVRPGAQEAVEKLRQHVDLFVVTSPFNSRNWVYERDWWLEKHFGFRRHEQVVHTAVKYLVAADACLDDKHSNVLTWHREYPDGLAMIWPTYHTRNMPAPDGYLVRDWQDVIERVEAHVNKPTTRHRKETIT
jgi:5'(3')-deoxyribonucleotidase